jgi:hypothetical protein
MAFPTGTESSTTLAVMIPQLWGTKINDFYRQKLKLAAFFTNRSDELAGGGDTVYTPGLTEMAANSKTNATQVTLNQPTETKQTLQVSNWFEVSFAIEDNQAAQVLKSYSIQQRYMKNAAYTAAKKLEVALATGFQSFTTVVGTTTVALADASVRSAISSAEIANIDFEECVWFLHPKTVWTDLMSIDRFALSLNTANATNPVVKGQMGTIYGQPLVTTNLITKINTNADYCGALAVADSIHFATGALPGQRDQNGVRLQANYVPDFLSTVITADILYGTVVNRAAGGIKIVSGV